LRFLHRDAVEPTEIARKDRANMLVDFAGEYLTWRNRDIVASGE
jgi:hypothetical protein